VGRRIGPAFRPCAPIVAVVGPDGAGKSTAIDHLSRTEGWVFTRVERRHWRPGVLPDLSAFTPGSIRARRFRVEPPAGAAGSRAGSPASGDDGGGPRPPRRRSGRLGRVRLAYYCADAWLGGWLRDRPAAGHQRLVLYDRCLLDMAVDPARYGLRDGAAVERWWTSLPRPDRVVLLAGSPDRIVERKPELTVPEVRRQIGEWRRLLAAGLVHDVVEADRPEREVAAALRRIVVEALLERNPPPPDLIASTPVSGRGASPPAATAGTERERCAS